MKSSRGLGVVLALSMVAGIASTTTAAGASERRGARPADEGRLRGVPAAPTDVMLVQPDGATFSAVPWGTTTFNGYEDTDGYGIAKDEGGVWRYTEDGEPTGARPDEGAPPAGVEVHDRPATPPVDVLAPAAGPSSSDGPPAGPHVPFNLFTATLVILAQYPDRASVGTTPAAWASSYFGPTGSVRDYYTTQSSSRMQLTPVDETSGTVNDGVVGWVTLPSNHPNTGALDNTADYNASHTTARDAITAADPYVDFAKYDLNGNGVIESRELHIVVIAAGYESSYGGESVQCGKNVWGHQWQIGGYSVTAPTVDGKVAGGDGYMLFGEQHCTTSEMPGHMATIGIMVHEMGHDLDMPDLYDIDSSSAGVGEWSVMGSASWNSVSGGYAGSTPGGLDPFSRIYQGWITPTRVGGTSVAVALQEASTHQVVQVLANPNGVDWNFYEQSGAGEYFLIENRQKTGYDAGLPGCGVLIWHIDETRTSTNSANATDARRLVDVEEADGLNHLDSKANRGDAGDPFPGSTGKTSFANATNPNSKLYSGAASGVSVSVPNTACSSTVNITVTAPQSVPEPPKIGTATAGNGQATVTWTAPTDNGGSPITGYTVTPYLGGVAQTPQTFASTATSQVVTGLTNTSTYTFKVATINAVGTSALSAESNAVTPVALPSAPTIGTATAGPLSAVVTWTTPSTAGTYPITGYRVIAYYGFLNLLTIVQTFESTATTQRFTGLASGTAYTFRVQAITEGGFGAASAASNSVTPTVAAVPDAPNIGSATRGDGAATVTWTAPAFDGGSAVTGYTVTPFIGAAAQAPRVFASTATSQVVTGLTNGTEYTFKVAATNAKGTGAASAASNAVTPAAPAAPGAPTIGTATRGNGAATVTWTAPAEEGDSPITGYTVTPYAGAVAQAPQTFDSTATSQVVTGLTNGTEYTFKVAATNAIGTGAQSDASNVVTPAAPPSAPTIGSATAGPLSAVVTWTAPSSSGTYPVTGYRVTAYYGFLNLLSTSRTFDSTATTQRFTGLTSGTAYIFRVAAISEAGVGSQSASSNSATPTVAAAPGAPVIEGVAKGNGQVTVSWAAPGFDGGSAVTGYTVTPYVGAVAQAPRVFASTATSQVVTGLANGTTYTFKVAATNAVGTGTQSAASNSVTPSAARAVLGDFDGDGTTDVAVFRPSNGGWYVDGAAVTYLGLPGDVPVPGDYDGDGDADLAVFRPSTGAWFVDGSPSATYFGLSGDVAVPGDYDGDGDTDIAVFRPSNGGWYVLGSGVSYLGLGTDIPVPADYDGDGAADLAVFRPSTGAWYVEGEPVRYHGAAGDVALPGDYDGDESVELAVFRPSAGVWYIEGAAPAYFGADGDIPVPGDYDSGPGTDIAVFRPSNGGWYIEGSPTTYFGLDGDIPAPRNPALGA